MQNNEIKNLFNLTGKTALVTGASSGLGEQFARTLSAAGARVMLCARRVDRLEKLASELDNSLAVHMDVADKSSVKAAFSKLEENGEKIDICVNNAGLLRFTPIFDDSDNNDFEDVMQTNVMGVWYVTKAVANHMKNHNIYGSIVNISSINGANKMGPETAAYCASKAAVIQMTKALVGELSSCNIRINSILPGLFRTEMTAPFLATEEKVKSKENMIPLNFIARPDDISGLILYLASNQASRYVTGSCFTIDGGISWGG